MFGVNKKHFIFMKNIFYTVGYVGETLTYILLQPKSDRKSTTVPNNEFDTFLG